MVVIRKCCCLELRTGNLIIGWIGLVISIACLIESFCFYSTYRIVSAEQIESDIAKRAFARQLSLCVFISVVGILMNIALIHSVLKTVRLMLIPWLLTVALFIIMLFFSVMITGFQLIINNSLAPFGAFIMFVDLTVFGFFSLLWICVFSFYQKMKEDERLHEQRLNSEAPFQVFPSIAVKTDTPPPAYDEHNF